MPVLADATSMQSLGGMILYMTATSVPDAAEFYEAQIAARGGQVAATMPASDTMSMLDIRLKSQSYTVMIMGGGPMGNNVSITSMTGNPSPPPSDCVMAGD